jgi:hypothetical protein
MEKPPSGPAGEHVAKLLMEFLFLIHMLERGCSVTAALDGCLNALLNSVLANMMTPKYFTNLTLRGILSRTGNNMNIEEIKDSIEELNFKFEEYF